MKKMALLVGCALLIGCSHPHEPTTDVVNKPQFATRNKLTVQTVAVGPNKLVQREFTASGGGEQPKITWSGVPPEAKEIEVLIEDTDAPGDEPYLHLLVEQIDPKQTEFPGPTGQVAPNTTGKDAYAPLDPTPGMPHHYHFEVLAVDSHFGIQPISREELMQKIASHVIASGEVVGTFGG